MKRRLPIVRTIVGIVAAIVFYYGVSAARSWWRTRREVADATSAILTVFPDALAVPGTVEAEFCPKYSFTCKEMLMVEYEPPSANWEEVQKTMAGVKGTMTIVDPTDGSVVRERELSEAAWSYTWSRTNREARLPAFFFGSLKGTYVLRLNVTEVPPALAGIPHRVVARYAPCGIETIQMHVLGAIALVLLLVAGGMATGIVVVTRRKARLRSETEAPAPLGE